MGYEDLDAYIAAMNSNYERGVATFEKVTADFVNMGIDMSALPDELTAGMAQNLANKTSMIIANFGQQAGQEFIDVYGGIVEGLNPEQVETFTNYLTDIDWSNPEEIEEFRK
jgi:hypothetical protein